MKLSDRLQSCADLVQRGNVAADVGTDHGYLCLYLLEAGICPHVYAADLREQPLASAKRNAEKAGYTGKMTFCLSDGLKSLPVADIDTVICAGMGGDNIVHILSDCPGVQNGKKQLILQPQSAVPELRRWLWAYGFSILRERLSQDGKFLYTAMEVRFSGVPEQHTPGEHFISPVLLESGETLLPHYFARMKHNALITLEGLRKAKQRKPELETYYDAVYEELMRMEEQYGLGQ